MKLPNALRREPVVSIATVVAALTFVIDALENQSLEGSTVVNWKSLIVVIGVAWARKKVWAQPSVDDAIERAARNATLGLSDDQLTKLAQQAIVAMRTVTGPAQHDADTPAELLATGGRVTKPGMTLVGEDGPEPQFRLDPHRP